MQYRIHDKTHTFLFPKVREKKVRGKTKNLTYIITIT